MISDFSYFTGAIAYIHLNNASINTHEFYMGGGYGPFSAKYYYAFTGNRNGWKKTSYINVVAQTELIGFNFGIKYGHAFPATGTDRGHIDFSVSKTIKMELITLIPSLMVSTRTKPYRSNGHEIVVGIKVAF